MKVEGEMKIEGEQLPLNMAYLLVKGDHLQAKTEEQQEQRETVREYKIIIRLLLEHPDVKLRII